MKLRTVVLLGLAALATARVVRRTRHAAVAVARAARDGDYYDDVLVDDVSDDDEREFFTKWSKAAKNTTSYSHGYVPSERAVADGDPTG